jgi:hypothetical protein
MNAGSLEVACVARGENAAVGPGRSGYQYVGLTAGLAGFELVGRE